MPSRNREKIYVSEAYYHVYNRGLNKQTIFVDYSDYHYFLSLLRRYLSKGTYTDRSGRIYESLYGDLELVAFCLMDNHFHLLIYQNKLNAVTDLLQRVGTSYTMYFNKKYKRSGPLFQERFKASLITRDEYLRHISRYIHLNPKNYRTWEFSSLDYYLSSKEADWVRPGRIIELFNNRKDYDNFVRDYEGYKQMLDEIKTELANT